MRYLLIGLILTGCSSAADGPKLEVAVAPLALPGIVEAVYDITVTNAAGDTVFVAEDITSTRYGDGRGAITYIGTCDASSNPHRVRLDLTSLSDEERELASPRDFVNPTPVVLADVVCEENADTRVTFDLTIMRSARQGFFDIAVNIEDVFCSAKVDCREAFLHDDAGERAATGIFAFACTSGQGSDGPEPTWMYMSDVTVTCRWDSGLVESYLIPIGTEGQGDAVPANQGIFGTSFYRDEEALPDIDKCFVNTAIGLDLEQLTRNGELGVCTLTATATVANAQWLPAATPSDTVYPVVTIDVPLTTEAGVLCENNALNALGSGVQTTYTTTTEGIITPASFSHTFACGTPDLACAGSLPGGNVRIAPSDDTLVVSVGNASATYALPPGASLGDTCCAAACCQ